MSIGTRKRARGWRFRKKRRQYARGDEKPSKHVRESGSPEGIAFELDGSQATEARDNSVAPPLIPERDVHEPMPAAGHSMCNFLVDIKSPSKDSEWDQTNLRDTAVPRARGPEIVHSLSISGLSPIEGKGPAVPRTRGPERVHSSSMSGLSPIESKGPEGTLPLSRDDIPLYSTDSEGNRYLSDLQGPNAAGSLAAGKFPKESRLETTDVTPLNSKNSETATAKFIPSTTPKSTTDSLNGHITKFPDLIVDAQASGSIPGELCGQESILDEHDSQTPLADIPLRPNSSLDNSDHQTPEHSRSGLNNHGHQATSDIPDHPEHSLVTAVLLPDEPTHPQPILEEEDHPEPTLNRGTHPEPTLDEGTHPEHSPEEPDSPGNTSDEQNCPQATSDAQSRTDSIKSHEPPNGRDRPPHVRLEARLPRLRWRNLMTRAAVSESRTQLRQYRNAMSDADAEFVKLSRQRWITGTQDDLALDASLKKLQATRDAYGPLEEAYNTLEERLDREEYELTKLEEKMFKDGVPIPDIQDSDLESQSDSSDGGGSEILEALKEQQNPLYKEYNSRLGDANLLREECSYLSAEHESLLEALEVRQRHGTKLQAEDETTLARFYAKKAKLSEELRQVDADVSRLRQECIQMGLLPGEEGDEIDILPASDGSIGPEKSQYSIYPQLLDQPDRDEDEQSSKQLLSEFRSGDTGDRITRWLLHKLRSSCSEVELLARFAAGLDRPVDTQKWQEEVLYFWFMDSANLPPSAYQLEPTLTADPSPPVTDPNNVQHKPFSDKQLIQLVIRSSSLSSSLEFGMLLRLTNMKGRSAVTT